MPVATEVEFQWFLTPDLNDEDARTIYEALQNDDPGAHLVFHEAPRGSLPLAFGAIIAGALAAGVLALRLVEVVCRLRKQGTLIDARTVPLRVSEHPQIPGGFIVVVRADGTTASHDACAPRADLERVILSLAHK